MAGATVPSVNDTTFESVTPTALQGPVACVARSIWNPVWLAELSRHWSVMEEAVTATTAKFDGAAGGATRASLHRLAGWDANSSPCH